MKKHERRCYKNPDRFCDNCQNTGMAPEDIYREQTWREFMKNGRIKEGTKNVKCIYCEKINDEVR